MDEERFSTMTAQAQLSTNPSTSLVQRALQADGMTCMVSGAIFTLASGPISDWVGVKPTEVILFFGLFLLVYGIGLFALATRKPVDARLPIIVIGLNALAAAIFVGLLIADPFGFTTVGNWMTLIFADIVVALGIWQYVGLRRMR
jgi:hypothetical protein